MVIKRFFILIILLMITPTLFAALTQDARKRKAQYNSKYGKKNRTQNTQLFMDADAKFKQLLALIPPSHQLTQQQQDEISRLQKEIFDAEIDRLTGQLSTKQSKKNTSTYICRRRNKIQEIGATDEIAEKQLYDIFLSTEQKKEIEGYQKLLASFYNLMKETKSKQESNTLSKRISRLKEKIKIVKAEAVLAFCDILEKANPSEALLLAKPATAFAIKQQEDINRLQSTIDSLRPLHANADDPHKRNAISARILRLNKKIKRIKANPVLAVDISRAQAACPDVPLEITPTDTETFDFASNYFNQINRFNSRE